MFKVKQQSPWFFFGMMIFSVFFAETLVMLMFLLVPKLPDLVEVFLDSSLLSLLVILYAARIWTSLND